MSCRSLPRRSLCRAAIPSRLSDAIWRKSYRALNKKICVADLVVKRLRSNSKVVSFFSGCSARHVTSCFVLEKSDHVGAILRIVHREHHFGSGDEGLWIGEPLVERGLVPDNVRSLQRDRVAVVRNSAGCAAEYVALAVDRSSMGRVSRGKTRRRMRNHEDDGGCYRTGRLIESAIARAQACGAADLRARPASRRSDGTGLARTQEEIANCLGLFPAPANKLPGPGPAAASQGHRGYIAANSGPLR